MTIKRIICCILVAMGIFFGNVISAFECCHCLEWLVETFEKPKVVLTIDDVPCPETLAIIKILEEEGVPATFFVVGSLAQEYPEIVRKISENNLFDIENHSMSHVVMKGLPVSKIYWEIGKCSEVIERITGIRPKFFRPPQGLLSDEIRFVEAEYGIEESLWTREGDSRYWVPIANGEDPVDVLQNKSVLLLHGGEKFGENDTEESIKYLRPLIQRLKTRFEIVKLSDL